MYLKMDTVTQPCPMDASLSNEPRRHSFKQEFLMLWIQAIPMVGLAVTTITFNALVLWMFKVKKSLRSCKNVYLGSLALADLMIGMCMFVATVHQLKSNNDSEGKDIPNHDDVHVSAQTNWTIQESFREVQIVTVDIWCKVYLTIRQAALYISLLSILLITLDRWWSIHYPLVYRAHRSKKMAVTAVCILWTFGFALSILPVSLWDLIVQQESSSVSGWSSPDVLKIKHSKCNLLFSSSFLYMIIVSAVQYLIPLSAMLVLNGSLYVRFLRRKRVQIRRSFHSCDKMYSYERQTSITSMMEQEHNSSPDQSLEHLVKKSDQSDNEIKDQFNSTRAPPNSRSFLDRRSSAIADFVMVRNTYSLPVIPANGQNIVSRDRRRRLSQAPQQLNFAASSSLPFFSKRLSITGCRRASTKENKEGEELAKEIMIRQDRRAAFWLGLLVVIFMVCWLPNTVVGIVDSLSPGHIPQWATDISLWVLLANSAINPVLYGLFNKEIRAAFRNWVRGVSGRKYRIKTALLYSSLNVVQLKRMPSFPVVKE